jgi:Family of unknown function (DUF5329)
MSLLRRSTAFLFACIISITALAAPAPPAVHSEIDALFVKLQAPGCQFNRNGSWYSGADAQAHLRKKLDYLEGKNMVKTTEDFITLGAATSSSSGKPYLVRCGESQPVESKVWLNDQLKILRQTK